VGQRLRGRLRTAFPQDLLEVATAIQELDRGTAPTMKTLASGFVPDGLEHD
jgi:hypothetical protein